MQSENKTIKNPDQTISYQGKCSVCKKKNMLYIKINWISDKEFQIESFQTMFNCTYNCKEIEDDNDIKLKYGEKTKVLSSKILS